MSHEKNAPYHFALTTVQDAYNELREKTLELSRQREALEKEFYEEHNKTQTSALPTISNKN